MFLETCNFVIFEASQSATLTRDADTVAQIDQLFTIELEFFCERINTYCHWAMFLCFSGPARSLIVGDWVEANLMFSTSSDVSPLLGPWRIVLGVC
jgi:hypothetical protein